MIWSGQVESYNLDNTSNLIGLGVFGFLGQTLYANALKSEKAAQVSIFGYL